MRWRRGVTVCAAALTACLATNAAAVDTVVTRPTDLRVDRYVDAQTIRALAAGTHVDLLQTEAGWVKVRVDGATGWVRATGLTGDAATVALLAKLDNGRSATGNIAMIAGIRRIPKASKHALIIGVDGVSTDGVAGRWPGVDDDVESARSIARRIGVPDDNIDVIGGTRVDGDALGHAIERLDERVQSGDQVLVYFSGPGTLVPDGASCTPAWTMSDGTALSAGQLAARLGPVLARVDKTLIVSDAAYRAGPSAPSNAKRASDAVALAARKVVAMPTTTTCPASNRPIVLPIVEALVAAGVAARNVVALQSAGPDQGVDLPRAGSAFTQSLVDCAYGDAIDVDRSSSLSVAELASCVDRAGAAHGPVSSAVSGNAGYSPLVGIVDRRAPERDDRDDRVAVSRAALDGIVAQRDARIEVGLAASRQTLQIGRDALDLTLTSNRAGFVYLVLLGSDERSFYVLFPNDLDHDNRIAAGATMRLPRPNWRVQAQGPAGRDVVLAVVAESERDLAPFAANREGPFGVALNDGQGRAQLQWLLGRSGRADEGACIAGGKRRNLAAVDACSDAFGAALITIVEQ